MVFLPSAAWGWGSETYRGSLPRVGHAELADMLSKSNIYLFVGAVELRCGVIHHLFLSLVFHILLFYSQKCMFVQTKQPAAQMCYVSPQWPHKRVLCLCVNSRSQMRDSSPFAGVVTACSLCVCRAVPTSQMPSCTPWDRIVLDSGKLMRICSQHLSVMWLPGSKKCLYPAFRILEVARCSQLTDVGFTTLARVSVPFSFWFQAETKKQLKVEIVEKKYSSAYKHK